MSKTTLGEEILNLTKLGYNVRFDGEWEDNTLIVNLRYGALNMSYALSLDNVSRMSISLDDMIIVTLDGLYKDMSNEVAVASEKWLMELEEKKHKETP